MFACLGREQVSCHSLPGVEEALPKIGRGTAMAEEAEGANVL